MINFWHRIRELPQEALAKKALLDNVNFRTNWIRTLEKLMNTFEITFNENLRNLKQQLENHVK